jgi:broad-specificity NMP kinase
VKELYNKVMGNSDRIVILEKENSELKERLEILEGKIDMLVK